MKIPTPQNPAPWDAKPFLECLGDLGIEKPGKLLARDYKPKGPIPVVDQGQQLIAGWTVEETLAIRENLPFIVFGDHTRAFKFINFPFALGADGTHLLKPAEGFNPQFFYYACLHLPLPNRGYNRHFTVLKEQALPKPPKPEQEKIAAVLWKIQRAIEVEGKLVATAHELRQSAMNQLFIEGLRTSPAAWKALRLGDYCTFTTGKLDSNAATPNGQYPFFTCSQETARINTYAFDQEAILLAGNNAQGNYSVKYFSGKFNAYQRTYVITIKDTASLDYNFLLYTLSRKLEELKMASLGTVTKYLTATIINGLDLNLPPVPEQKEIASILQMIDRKISIHERKHAALSDLFQTMLHQLMTAQIRVDELDIDASEVAA